LLAGTRSMRDRFLSTDFDTNLPFQIATIQYLLGNKGKTINVLMPYAQKLIRFADWYRQLLAESIGKKLNSQGDEVNVGLTPINALGATDQHSQNQLYNEGPNDKLIMFIEVEKFSHDPKIPNLYPQNTSLAYINNIGFTKLLNTEKKGTEQSLCKNDRPNLTIKIDQINAFTLGELFMLFEGATAFLGEYFKVNAFDQPGVELSKILTREMLS
jgi:glucose-6-phosphate isomerase